MSIIIENEYKGTIDIPYEKIAECCCSVVRKRIPPTLEIEYEIVERESVGPVPGKG